MLSSDSVQEIQSGRLVRLDELQINSDSWLGRSVNVLGKLTFYNVHSNVAIIEMNTATLIIDTSLLGVFSHRLKSLYQFIGELAPLPVNFQETFPQAPLLILNARIIRNVDGMDTSLYDKAMAIRREFERDRNAI